MPGDVQWMTAGSGVIHSEMPTEAIRRDGGRLHGFQVWVNLPAKDKMIEPRYQEYPGADRSPRCDRDGRREGTRDRGAGGWREGRGRDAHAGHVPARHRCRRARASTAAVPASQNAIAYAISGDGEGELTVFAHDGDVVELANDNATEPAELLVLAGEPLREPVARYGPFVMTTKAEIGEAIDDYQAGRFGAIAR